MEAVDMRHLLTALAEVEGATTDTDAPKIVLDLPKDAALKVIGVEDRLVQVLRNIIANAKTFSPPRGTIRISAVPEGKFIAITVDDQGPGLPDGKLEAIFDRFYTERPAGEKFGRHSGLGLSISKQIMEAHDGQIFAENMIGPDGKTLGARFVVRVPAL